MRKGQDLSFPLFAGALYLVSFTGRYACGRAGVDGQAPPVN